MKSRTIWILVLVALFAILLVQNSMKTTMIFYFWSIDAPLFILVFFIFLIGFLVGFLAAKSGRKKDALKEDHIAPPSVPRPPSEKKP